jgi:SAM-dependent methyltransferase
MQDSSKEVMVGLLGRMKPRTVLDVPSGNGWLRTRLAAETVMDGIDLYAEPLPGYRTVHKGDLDAGIAADLPLYESVVSCEGIEHFGNPLLFLRTAKEHLADDGTLIVTTPNIWYPAARLQYLMRGFFPSFPCLAGKIMLGSHMHIMPWSFSQLYLYLTLAGFDQIELHEEPLSQPGHFWERLFAVPQFIYCKSRLRRAKNGVEKEFWVSAGKPGSVLGRHLIVSAKKKKG